LLFGVQTAQQSGSAARAEATAMSISTGVASAISAATAPVAGLITWWRLPAVRTGTPSIQLLGITGPR
jgi:hypothetical protein